MIRKAKKINKPFIFYEEMWNNSTNYSDNFCNFWVQVSLILSYCFFPKYYILYKCVFVLIKWVKILILNCVISCNWANIYKQYFIFNPITLDWRNHKNLHRFIFMLYRDLPLYARPWICKSPNMHRKNLYISTCAYWKQCLFTFWKMEFH